jgi:maleamate amidohydrolase
MAERVWDRFLTPEDKDSLKDRPAQVWGYGERPALVLVDLYRWVFGDSRPASVRDAMREWPGSCGPRAWDAIPHIRRVLGAARAAGLPIVHTTGLDPADSGVLGWSTKDKNEGARYATDDASADRLRRRFHIIDEFAPVPGEAVLRKASPSAFFGTLLAAHLHANDVDGIILAGESTSGCVRATCVDGRSYRFKMTVCEEGVFDRHMAAHAINLFDMHEKYADVLGVDTVVGHLEKLAGKTPAFA